MAMKTALEHFQAEIAAGRETVAADFAFHTLVAEATDNRYFTSVMASLGPKSIPRARLKYPGMTEGARRDYLIRVNREHQDIYDAIQRGDADGARAAMRNHIGNGRERLKLRQQLSDNQVKTRRKT
jgi:DNA-binding FadR family transcriptional regulator